VTAFLGLGGAGLAFAVGGGGGTPSASLSASSSTSSTTLPADHPRIGKGMRPFGPGFGGHGGVVHGQFTIRSGSSYKTVSVQTGQVTSVSTGSITVASPDGFTQTYTVEASTIVDSQAGGISAVAKNDTVHLEGVVQGGKTTATDIVDVTKIGASRQGFGFGSGPGGPARGFDGPGPAGGGPAGPSTAT
jgi:hypothetical protein